MQQVQVLAKGGIPLVMPSSGSMANNGAITITTALPTTYPNCYLYLPAGALFTNSNAGWYYTVMSSATVGQVFNNQYTSGVPSVPTTPFPFVSTGPGAYTQTTGSDITGLSLSIPADTLTANSVLRLLEFWGCSNTAGNKFHKTTFGGTQIDSFTDTTTATDIISRTLFMRGSQALAVTTPTGNAGFGQGGAGLYIYPAVSTTGAVALNFTHQLAAATDFLTLEAFLVEVCA